MSNGVGENIPADSLDNVLHEFRTVGFDALPFFVCANTYVGDGFAAELVLTNLRFDIRQISAGRQGDKQRTANLCNVLYFHLMILSLSIKTNSSLLAFKSSNLSVNPLLENTPYMKR